MFFTSYILVLAILRTTNAQVFSLGHCDPQLKGVDNLDKTRYLGKWYLVKKTYSADEEDMKCSASTCTLVNGTDYEMTGNIIFKNPDIKPIQETWFAKADENISGKWILTPGYIADSQPVWAFDTDYDNYAISYSCMDAHKGKLEFVWIDSRTPKMDAVTVEKIERILKNRNLNHKLIDEIQDCENV